MTPTIYKYEQRDDFVADTVAAIEDVIEWTLQNKDSVRVALSGGKSPLPVYRELARNQDLDWENVELFLVDERYVPKSSPNSNAGAVERILINAIPHLKGFYSFNTSLPPEQAVEEYDQTLRSQPGEPLFDLVLLGMGEDGHTASLFPKSPLLEEKSKWALSTAASGRESETRLTLTFPALLNSGRIMFLIQGEKGNVLKKWEQQKASVQELPAIRLLEHPHVEAYFLDEH